MSTGRVEPLDLDSLRRRRSDILRLTERYGASNVRVFGSVARGEAGLESDIDLVVEFEADRSLLDLIGLTSSKRSTAPNGTRSAAGQPSRRTS
jgi:uncharacterized protein